MHQPMGFVDADRPHYVCRLRKAIYDLKQAPQTWYLELKNYLVSIGFTNSVADTSLFILRRGSHFVYLLVYVDDILVTGSCSTLITQTLDTLASRFSIKEPKPLHYFLGIEAVCTPQGLHLMHRKYTHDLLTANNMMHTKPVSTPMAFSTKLGLHSGTSLSDGSKYMTLVGSL